jgi:hypothetical protein
VNYVCLTVLFIRRQINGDGGGRGCGGRVNGHLPYDRYGIYEAACGLYFLKSDTG